MIKDILVNLSMGDKHPATDYAASLAQLSDAHLGGIAFRFDPAMQTSAFGLFPPTLVEMAIQENEQAVQRATGDFERAAQLAGVSFETVTVPATLVGAGDAFGQTARRFDLVIVGQPRPDLDAAEELLIEAALFDSGRPVIVVPYIHKGIAKLDRVAVCWDGSRVAARAVGDAMPLLHRAKAIDLVMIKHEEHREEIEGADIAQHLARHGLPITLAEVPQGDVDAGNVILNYVADHAIDLMVMGGYGHSRLREQVFGGTTRTVLASMTAATLMSH
jgi:nucleotide-binding universal stress UspA family protein